MVKHKGGKVGKAAAILSSPKSTKKQKSNAGKILKDHQDKEH
ncbi:hypothetical protein [Sporosarcina koreensis]|uniref:Uncharacterized protein n=1 Tax=Sporosarcina koreensis TaxID=334735 RepID=A0ABW0TVB5_9BACL